MMAKYVYSIQFKHETDGWRVLPRMQDTSLLFLRGWLHGRRDSYCMSQAMRIVRDDGYVVEEMDASLSAPIGMVAGFPSREQYARAAMKALIGAGDHDLAQQVEKKLERGDYR